MRQKVWFLGVFVFLGLMPTLRAEVTPKVEGETAWYDATKWEPEGRGWSETLRYFDRLPAKAEKTVRKPVWCLSRDSAGMLVRFATDANQIDVHYKLFKPQLAMPHMPATGVSGVDLYVKHDGQWRWLGISRPSSQEVKATLAKDMPSARREYMLYLPLYNGVDSLEIGVPKGASFEPITPRDEKPIVYYGTSIAQGGCASRPGMAHTSILGRKLDHPVINLGFSGNGDDGPVDRRTDDRTRCSDLRDRLPAEPEPADNRYENRASRPAASQSSSRRPHRFGGKSDLLQQFSRKTPS